MKYDKKKWEIDVSTLCTTLVYKSLMNCKRPKKVNVIKKNYTYCTYTVLKIYYKIDQHLARHFVYYGHWGRT